MARNGRISGEYASGTITIEHTCPACRGPLRYQTGDSAGWDCLDCDWTGGGYETLRPDYPDVPTRVDWFGLDIFTGGKPGPPMRFVVDRQ